MILGFASPIHHTTHALPLNFDVFFIFVKLLTLKVKEICPSGLLHMIFHGTTLCTAVLLSYVIKYSKY